jgi:hypothetical protein
MPSDFNIARESLTSYVLHKAHNIRGLFGFSYWPEKDAPGTFEELQKVFQHSLINQCHMPVYSGGSTKTIYTSAEGNYAFRFWHDVLHCVHNLDFSYEGESAVAMLHLMDIGKRFGFDSLEFLLMQADTIGQVEYFRENQAFIDDQLSFALEYIKARS